MPFDLAFKCKECNLLVTGKEHGSFEIGDDNYSFAYPYETKYVLVSCPKCSRPYVLWHGLQQQSEDEYSYGPPAILFPESRKLLDSSVPVSVAQSYQGAQQVFL